MFSKKFAIVYLSLIYLCTYGLAIASNSEFNEAHKLLSQKNTMGAVALLKQHVASGVATPGEWSLYSIAMWNSFGDDSLGSAIRAATAAFRLAPTTENRQLLEWLQQKVTNRVEGIPEIALFKFLRNLLLTVPIWLYAILINLGIIIVFSWWYFKSHPVNKSLSMVHHYTFLSIGVVILFVGLLTSIWRYNSITNQVAFVTESGVSLFQKPDFSSKEIGSISTGTEVKPLNTFGRWQEVRLSDGRVGWVQGSILEYLILD